MVLVRLVCFLSWLVKSEEEEEEKSYTAYNSTGEENGDCIEVNHK